MAERSCRLALLTRATSGGMSSTSVRVSGRVVRRGRSGLGRRRALRFARLVGERQTLASPPAFLSPPFRCAAPARRGVLAECVIDERARHWSRRSRRAWRSWRNVMVGASGVLFAPACSSPPRCNAPVRCAAFADARRIVAATEAAAGCPRRAVSHRRACASLIASFAVGVAA
jgi:hypothetical protein